MLKNWDETKAIGPDEVSGHILKNRRQQIIDPVYDIIKCSVESGNLPQQWKRADVIPIYMSGSKEQPLNYRLVPLTSIVCTLCERIIKKQWTEFLEKESFETKRQFAFREGRSCVTNLLSFFSRIIDATQERERWADCRSLHLKEAFDKVSYETLLWKMENVGGLKGVMRN